MHDKNSLDFEEKGKIENILKDSLDSIPSPSPSMKIQNYVMFAWGVKAKHCWLLSSNFWKNKVCWHHPAMFCLITSRKFPANNLNFLWRSSWWDQIQDIFLNLFYFTFRDPRQLGLLQGYDLCDPSFDCRPGLASIKVSWIRARIEITVILRYCPKTNKAF